MNFKVVFSKEATHSELVSCVGWASSSELYSIGDDHTILRWNVLSDEVQSVATLPHEVYCTDIHWYPTSAVASKKPLAQSELFVLACTDGRFLLVSKAGRVEKAVEAHKGAVLGTRWGHDGTTLLTFGEDAAVKVWSRTGMLRSVLVQSSSPVHAATWSPDSNQVIYTAGSSLVIKPLQPSIKPTQWKAHDALILAVDWSATNSLIISAGEDRKYKVWDSYGRALYSSLLHDSPIVSLSWAPDGELFAVGGFNTLRLCDKAGWSHCLEKPSCGTILQLAWSLDSTQVGGACGSGQVLMANVVGRRMEWRHLTAVINDNNTITIKNVLNNANELLEFNDKVVRASLDWGHLVVTTTTSGFIYRENSWTSPVVFDLRTKTVNLLKQAEKHFLIAESQGLQIMSYEGRVVSSIKHPGLQTDSLNTHTVSVSNDTVAVRSKQEPNVVRLFDAMTGKELGDSHSIQHKVEVTVLCLNYSGPQQHRQLAFIDKNHDLYIAPVRGTNLSNQPVMLGSMVTSLAWNSSCNMLAGMQNNKLLVWYHPAVVFTDRDLLPHTVVNINKRTFSKSPQVVKFCGNHCTLHRSDGAVLLARVSPFPAILSQHVLSNKWTEAVSLCRLAKDPALWACLAGMAASSRELPTATTAYAAINEVDKVEHLNSIQGLASSERRNAELALFAHQPHLAEAIYLQAKMIFRAIELNLNLFNWERALELALRHKTHVDTVLAYRQRYIQEMGIEEKSKKFRQYADKITIDWEKIDAKLAMEEEN